MDNKDSIDVPESPEIKLFKENEPVGVHPWFFLVCGAGSDEVNGVYKNLDANVNDNTFNYKMVNNTGQIFKLYRTPSEDGTKRYWMIEERNKDYYYMVEDGGDLPPETGWVPYMAGQLNEPEVTKIPREVEVELRTRIELQDTLTTLDLTTEYGEYCPTVALKRLYLVLWLEQSPEAQAATRRSMAKAKADSKKKKQKPKPKINVTISLGKTDPKKPSRSFQLNVTFDAIVWYIKKLIAQRLALISEQQIELLLNGNRILSDRGHIDKLGIRAGAILLALNRESESGGNGLLTPFSQPIREIDRSNSMYSSFSTESQKNPTESRSSNGCCTLF